MSAEQPKRYVEIIRKLSELIQKGGLTSGDRLPSERHISDRLDVGRSFNLALAGRSSRFFSPARKSKTGISRAGLPKSSLLGDPPTLFGFSLAPAGRSSRFFSPARKSKTGIPEQGSKIFTS
ncbi:GntR family transcriptional regulator [Shouchella shacheensis]|uniref:GntR family transcriptional regulator n=1 Tax=Shouchella shacheensis TaxID=1649580 RepID=UPI00073FB173|nr:GntR family transcriptional regulator [Shouchella shacheensis]